MTNLNLTGMHCHSMDLQVLLDSLPVLRSLSLTPCTLIYVDRTSSAPYRIHSITSKLVSLNLVCHSANMNELCSILYDDFVRHSSTCRHSSFNRSVFSYEQLVRTSIRHIIGTTDLQHFSVRCPAYRIHADDLPFVSNNHLQSLIVDGKLSIGFHSILTLHFSLEHFACLRRLIVVTNDDFSLTELLLDKCRSMELVEIISLRAHVQRSTLKYIERVLTPTNYVYLHRFHYCFGSVDAQHLLKHLRRTVRAAFVCQRPAFEFDVRTIAVPLLGASERTCALYDHTHDIHRDFHVLSCARAAQLSIVYPNFLNYRSLYSERSFDK
jgi:hypothetical protein